MVKTNTHDWVIKALDFAVPGEAGDRLPFAQIVVYNTVAAFWDEVSKGSTVGGSHQLRPPPCSLTPTVLSGETLELAQNIGRKIATLDVADASYAIGRIYTETMPRERRSKLGAYYTPPALCERLLDMASQAGVDWSTARVLDPACGGGAFLSPVAMRMAASMKGMEPAAALESVENRLYGIELDPFAAWLSQVFLDATLIKLGIVSNRLPRISVQVGDALECNSADREFDLVVGNPPYGRVSLSTQRRREYARSLYGHANMYGLFTDLALRYTRIGGTVAYVTPTSFLAGAYFKTLRKLLGQEAPPVSIDFITERKGVFSDALQETALSVYRRGAQCERGEVRFISVVADGSIETTSPTPFWLPEEPENPWLIPRSDSQAALVRLVDRLPHRLSDYGYQVSTGPLVWNRHKDGLSATLEEGKLPLIWAESVRSEGVFEFRADQRTHQPYFQTNPGQEWLITRAPCVLLQRTTAKEQDRRLIAAELPVEFDAKYGGVVVENHLNIVKPRSNQPKVSTGVMAALLNSNFVDQIFRCINGSVAVSAYELESLPLPPPENMQGLETLVARGADSRILENEVERLYCGITG